MKNQNITKLFSILYPILSIALMLALWQAVFAIVGSEFIFPSVGATAQKMAQLLASGGFWLALLSTLGRVILCFVLSFVLATIFACLSHFCTPVGKILQPIVAIFRSAPTVAMMVILILLVNDSLFVPVLVGLFVLFPLMYATTTSALKQVDQKTLQMCSLYNVPKRQQLAFVYLPTVAPFVLGQMPSTLSFAVKIVVSAEILSYTYQSLGGLIQNANVYVDMSSLFALTILSVLFASLLDFALTFALKKFTKGVAQ